MTLQNGGSRPIEGRTNFVPSFSVLQLTSVMDKSGHLAASGVIKPETSSTIDDEKLREYQANPNVPADAKALATLLRSSGVTDYDPKIINQLLDFMHRTFLSI